MCDPCRYCQNYWSTSGSYDEPPDSGCKAEGDDRLDGWEPNGTTPCPCFKPFLPSDCLYEQLYDETQYIWYLQDEVRERDLTDKEKKEIARIEGITLNEVDRLIAEWGE